MSTATCNTCAAWEPNDLRTWGRCRAINHEGSWEGEGRAYVEAVPDEDDLCILAGGHLIAADLHASAEFGCRLWRGVLALEGAAARGGEPEGGSA